MKTVCVYHSIDLDGWMSAAIVEHWFIKNNNPREINGSISFENHVSIADCDTSLDFIGYNYGQPIPDLSEYDRVIMCDISFPKEEMSKLWHNLSKKLIWIDHHISAIKDNDDLVFDGIRDTKFAACELTWSYFFPNETMPEIVRLLGLYDSFRHKGTDEETKVLEFQYGAREAISNYEEAYIELRDNMYCENTELSIWNYGKYIYKYLCTEAKQVYEKGFEFVLNERVTGFPNSIEFKSRKFICINKERFNPINFGIDYHKDGYDGCASFYFDGQEFVISLYNDNGLVDCSAIAKELGGGGHRGASGFRISPEGLTNFLRLNR